MYLPKHFSQIEQEKVKELIKRNGFAPIFFKAPVQIRGILNGPTEDKQGIIDGLNDRKDDMSKIVHEMRIKNESNK